MMIHLFAAKMYVCCYRDIILTVSLSFSLSPYQFHPVSGTGIPLCLQGMIAHRHVYSPSYLWKFLLILSGPI